jgi:hypothetical protein
VASCRCVGPSFTSDQCRRAVDLQVHHVRKLADLHKPVRPDKPAWVHLMAMRRRKTLTTCSCCHHDIHAGRATTPATDHCVEVRRSQSSRVAELPEPSSPASVGMDSYLRCVEMPAPAGLRTLSRISRDLLRRTAELPKSEQDLLCSSNRVPVRGVCLRRRGGRKRFSSSRSRRISGAARPGQGRRVGRMARRAAPAEGPPPSTYRLRT